MKIIDGEVYVNKDDAMNAMLKELDSFEKEKGVDGSILMATGLTMALFVSRLFKTEGSEQDEH